MAFLRTSRIEDDLEVIPGKSIVLRTPRVGDFESWAALRKASRSHLVPWEPAWGFDDLSWPMFRKRLKAAVKDMRDDIAYPYFIFSNDTDAILGGITLSNVRRGAAQTASLGYWMGKEHSGKGVMQEAVRTLLPVAFSVMRLNRIEAATMPANTASIRVLEQCGFAREGLAKAYLKINGRYEDHLLYARVATPQTSGLSLRWSGR